MIKSVQIAKSQQIVIDDLEKKLSDTQKTLNLLNVQNENYEKNMKNLSSQGGTLVMKTREQLLERVILRSHRIGRSSLSVSLSLCLSVCLLLCMCLLRC